MKTLTVHEASQNLGGWVRRAANGEQIAIGEGVCVVKLQPLTLPVTTPSSKGLTAREALRELQLHSSMTEEQAENYLRQVRSERLADGQNIGG